MSSVDYVKKNFSSPSKVKSCEEEGLFLRLWFLFFSFDRSFNQQPTTFPGMEVILPSSQPEYFQGEEIPRTSSPFGVYSHVVLSMRQFVSSCSLWVWRKEENRGIARIFPRGGHSRDTIQGSPTIYGLYRSSPLCISGLSRIFGAWMPILTKDKSVDENALQKNKF